VNTLLVASCLNLNTILYIFLQLLDERQSLNVWRFLEAINGYEYSSKIVILVFLFEEA